jgi:tetratricopeptide (TPR) repeat protein
MKLVRAVLFLLGIACLLAPATHAVSTDDAAVRLKELVDEQKKVFAKAETAGDDADTDALREQLQQLAGRYDLLIKDHENFVPAYVAYGLMLGKAGMRKESVTMLLRANQLDKDLPLVKNQLGNYLAEEGKPLDAVNYFLSAIKLAPEEPLYHYQLGMLLTEARDDFIKSGQWTRATLDDALHHAFERAMTLAPDDWRYAYQYGLSFYDLETSEWEAALQFWTAFEKRLKPGVEQEVCRLHQAKILHELNRTEEARTLLARVTEPALARQKDKISTFLSEPVKPAAPVPSTANTSAPAAPTSTSSAAETGK